MLKLPSTPADPAAAVRAGIARLVGGGRVRLHYGSTVATNALLERRGARTVLVTTAGFEDVIEIGRQVRPLLYALEPERPAPLVARRDRLGVRERMLVDGRVETSLDARAVRAVVAAIRRRRPDAVAIALLHSYANPRHELALRRAVAPLGVHVTLSHRLVREHREYERTATAVINAYVGPRMTDHLARLRRGVAGGVRVMQSNGGLVRAARAAAEPVRTVLSGPAGGVVGAARAAARARLGPIVALDMGGTSTDVSVVDGPLAFRTETAIAGLPIRVPALDIHTVGAGGGSIARLDAGGALRVGPESAGADPGPACYGRGTEPTVTDANLVLGRLVATEFLGGTMTLDVARARAALAPLARRLRRTPEQVADGIVRVATATMERAVRVITVERGHDPRRFTLVAFGGAGGLHACALADALGMRGVYVPPDPGVLSATGIRGAAILRDFVRTLRATAPREPEIRAAVAGLARLARAEMRREHVARPLLDASLDVRYAGQSYEVGVPWTPGWRRAFDARHAELFGHADATAPVEVVAVRMRARSPDPPAAPLPPATRGRRAALVGRRDVVFDGRCTAATHRREALARGARIRGPAIVCEYSATTVVPPGWHATVDRVGGLLVERR